MSKDNAMQMGTRDIVTVCIAVSLAVVMVASLMPSMMPAEEPKAPIYYVDFSQPETVYDTTFYAKISYVVYENGASTTLGSITSTDINNAKFYMYEDPTQVLANLYSPTSPVRSFIGNESGIWVISTETPGWQPIGSTSITETLESAGCEIDITEEDARTMFSCQRTATTENPFVPPPPSANDTIRAIVIAIVALIFVGIALTTLNTTLFNRRNRKWQRNHARDRCTRSCAKPTVVPVQGSREGSTTTPVPSVA